LIALFKQAITAVIVLERSKTSAKDRAAAQDIERDFRIACNMPPWERHDPLSPQAQGEMLSLQIELLAKIAGSEEAKAWRAYVRRWQKKHDAEMTEEAARPAHRAARKDDDLPRLEPSLHWAQSTKRGW
jgi:hypothetical protein